MRLPRPRFSLRTLVILPLFATCIAALYYDWGNMWRLERVIRDPSGDVSTVWLSPGRSRFLTTSGCETARVWETAGGECAAVLSGHEGQIPWACFRDAGRLVVTVGTDRTVRIWDAGTGECLHVLGPHARDVECADLSEDGRRMIVWDANREKILWDVEAGKRLRRFSDDEMACAFWREGRYVLAYTACAGASGRTEHRYALYDAETGDYLREASKSDLEEVKADVERRAEVARRKQRLREAHAIFCADLAGRLRTRTLRFCLMLDPPRALAVMDGRVRIWRLKGRRGWAWRMLRPQVVLTVLFAALLAWSIVADRRRLRSRASSPTTPEPGSDTP